MKAFLASAIITFSALLPLESYANDWELVRTHYMLQLVAVDKEKESDKDVYRDAWRTLCTLGERCFILFWSDRDQIPLNLPMNDAQASAQVASYTRNPHTGYTKFLWNCRIRNDPENCFSGN